MNLTKIVKYNGLVTGIILICLLMPFLPVNTAAADTTLPEVFYGDIAVNGAPAPAGTVIVASIGGVARGSFTTIEEGAYGGPGTFDPHLIVSGEDPDIGETITFLVNGYQAEQTAIFEDGESRELNLTAWVYPLQSSDTQVADALYYLRWAQSQHSNGSIGGFEIDAWVVMAIAAAGQDPGTWTAGGSSIVDYLRDNSGILNANAAADWERSILAIVAAGENPRDFGGVNYVETLLAFYNSGQIGDDSLLNDDFWGILALSAIGEGLNVIEASKNFIIANQNSDGGWNWAVGGSSDADNTAAAISALIAAGESASSPAVIDALAYLKTQQQNNGGFISEGVTNSGVASWVINAIKDAGQSPVESAWQKTGNNPIEYLLSLQDTDGFFNYRTGVESQPEWMTAYALIALMGNSWPKDTTPPVISNLTPASGASTSETSLGISASFSDATSAIDISRVRMVFDGSDVTGSAYVTASGISYAADDLAPGTHHVIVAVSDKAGNETIRNWSFQVEAGEGGGGGGGGAAAGVISVLNSITQSGRFLEEVSGKSEDRMVELTIPKGTTGKNRVGGMLSAITIKPITAHPSPPAQSNIVGLVYDFGPDGATFDPHVIITFHYSASQIPDDVAEENLVLAVWNENNDVWEELPCTVYPGSNKIVALASHFSAFAILAHTEPAEFTLSELSITPNEVDAGDEINVSVLITNSGDLEDDYEVSLRIDGVVVRTKDIVLAGGDSERVRFSITAATAGISTVIIGGLSGSFTVREETPSGAVAGITSPPSVSVPSLPPAQIEPDEPEESQPTTITPSPGTTNWLVIGVVVAAVLLAGIVVFFAFRRSTR